MTHEHQVTAWRGYIKQVLRHPAARSLEPDAHCFLEEFSKKLLRQGTAGRANVYSPFTRAVKELIEKRGFSVDASCASVEVAEGLWKTADVSFSTPKKQWVIEIKLGLDFASLACAALQGAGVAQSRRRRTRVARLALRARSLCTRVPVCAR